MHDEFVLCGIAGTSHLGCVDPLLANRTSIQKGDITRDSVGGEEVLTHTDCLATQGADIPYTTSLICPHRELCAAWESPLVPRESPTV